MATDRLDGLLGSLSRQYHDAEARLSARTLEVHSHFSQLSRALDSALLVLEAHATARQVRAVDDLDVERVRQLAAADQLEDLSRREARYLVLSFPQFPARGVARLLELRPGLRRTFARQVLLHWETSFTHSDWNEYADLLRHFAPSESPIQAPLSLHTITHNDGARKAAQAVRADTLAAAHRTLVEDWRLQPSWSLTPHILVEWIRGALRTRNALTKSIKELLDSQGEDLRALLLPPPAPTSGPRSTPPSGQPGARSITRGSRRVQVRAVATLLEARFAPTVALDDATFAALEPVLLRSAFGDPRTVTTSDAWTEVRALATQPYDAFLQGLVREDLALFFQHLMRQEDRQRFWLRYLGSIRRTLCVLDPDAYLILDHKLTGAPEGTRAALKRVVRTRSKDLDQCCAFCLFFDNFVMVEFSIVGNAGYLYDRQTFEQRFLGRPQGGELFSPASLKDQKLVRFRLVHQRHWQHEMEMQLLRCDISPDRRGQRTTL